jgi:Ner family transcriptional regulator
MNEMNRTDMHPADIIAQLKAQPVAGGGVAPGGAELVDIGQHAVPPVAEGEFLIAQALGIDPAEIWPSRYFDREGNPIDRKKLIRDRRE